MKEKSPNFKYLYSHILEQEIAVHKETGWLFCADGTKYSPKELELIRFDGGKITKELHEIKKRFDGEITKVDIVSANMQTNKQPEQKPTTSTAKQNELELF